MNMEWIKVQDRLPEQNGEVKVMCKFGGHEPYEEVDNFELKTKIFWDENFENDTKWVTHWKPI